MATDIRVITAREFLETTGEGTYNFERSKAFLQSIAPADFHVLLDVRDAPYKLTLADISTLAVEFTRFRSEPGARSLL